MERLTYKYTRTCSRTSIIIAVIACAVSLAVGIIIGWFSRVPGSNNSENTSRFDMTKFLLDNLNKDNIRSNLRRYTNQTRLPGTALDKELGDTILRDWLDAGIDTAHFQSYNVLLSFPNSSVPNKIQIIDSNNASVFTSAPFEVPVSLKDNTNDIVPPYNAYSPAGTVIGDLVYVNYAQVEDFEYITKNLSMNLTGKILIARYGKIYRGDKSKLAAQYNAAGLILYNDPKDFNPDNVEPYPNSWGLPPTGLQRGTIGGDGDYMTPLYPATDYAYRIPLNNLSNLPSVPTQPIGYGDAYHLLSIMSGPNVPEEWQGTLNFTYKFGPGFVNTTLKARLEVNNFLEVRPVYNVIGYIEGDTEPDRYVLLGNHHDAWAFGAVDPLSGSASLTEIIRVFGLMLKEGNRPRRTIVFCSWDGEEPGLLGSMEFVEEKMKILYERAVAYLNVDYAVDFANSLAAGTSPLLQDHLYNAAKKVPSPKGSGTLYSYWLAHPTDLSSHSGSEPQVFYSLGSGSDMATFYQRAGTPCIDMWFTYDQVKYPILSYPTYHSAYETFNMFSSFTDPTFDFSLTMARLWSVLASDIANTGLLNMDVRRYAKAIRNILDSLLEQFEETWKSHGVNIDGFRSSVQNFTQAADQFAEQLKALGLSKTSDLQIRMYNDRLIQLERAFIDPEGLPDRPHYKHVIFAPSRFDAYSDNSFPGIVDTMYDLEHNTTDDWGLLKHQVYVATFTVQSAANTLSNIGL